MKAEHKSKLRLNILIGALIIPSIFCLVCNGMKAVSSNVTGNVNYGNVLIPSAFSNTHFIYIVAAMLLCSIVILGGMAVCMLLCRKAGKDLSSGIGLLTLVGNNGRNTGETDETSLSENKDSSNGR